MEHASEVKPVVFLNKASGSVVQDDDHMASLAPLEAPIIEFGLDINLSDQIVNALHQGYNTVVAAGGDGTVNLVVNALMQLDPQVRPRMAILPLGTANDFAGTLCVPDAIADAIELVRASDALPIDIIRVSGPGFERYYANVAAGGNSVRVSEEMTSDLKARWGAWCYLRGAISVLTDLESYRIDATCDGERFNALDTWAVLVANGKTNAGRIFVAPDASPADGLMDVILIRDGTLMDVMSIVGNALLGDYLRSEHVVYRQVQRFTLNPEHTMRFSFDGEVFEETPLNFEVVPGAINMIVGHEFPRLVLPENTERLAMQGLFHVPGISASPEQGQQQSIV